MMKKILPTLIGVALAGGMTAASADVQVFGHIDEALANIKVDNGTTSSTDTTLNCTTCSIGFKGNEDLGNGLSAIFSLDFQYDVNNAKGLTDRDKWVGLAGSSFGQVRIGTISTSYKSHGAMIDPGYRTIAQMRDVGLQSGLHSHAGQEGQGRATNTIRWDSPDFSGVKVTATYTVDSTKADGETDNPYGIGAQYQNGGILVYADYLSNQLGGKDSAYKLGGKYSMDNFAVFGQYEFDEGLISMSNNGLLTWTGTAAPTGSSANQIKGADVWMLGGSYTMDSNTVYAAYGQGKDDNDPTFNSKYDSWEVVGVHGFSKSTLAYAGYVNMKGDNKADIPETTVWTIGMKKKF